MSDLAKDATFTNYVVSTMVNKLSKTQMAEEDATKSQKEGKQKRKRKSQKSGSDSNPGNESGTPPHKEPNTSTVGSEGDEVELFDKSKRLVCRGVLTAQTEVHGRVLNTDWVAVMVQEVVSKGKVEPWPEFPTHSGEVEEGSFVAWPTTHTRTQQSAPIAPRPNLSEQEVLKDALHPDQFVSPGTIMSRDRKLRSRK